MDQNLDGCISALTTIENRLDSLARGGFEQALLRKRLLHEINESLRQQFFQTTIPQTGAALTSAAAQLKRQRG